MKVVTSSFGQAGSKLFTIENDNGLVFEVSDYGARLVRLLVPNKAGELVDIVLGFSSQEEYASQDNYLGATIGRVAGRLAQGRFTHEGVTHQFDANEKSNTLHGGALSFETKIWDTTVTQDTDSVKVTFTYASPAGENGFPGNLLATVVYTFNNQNEWHIDYQAETDETTLYNPTNHVYFNLSGDLATSVGEHQLFIDGETFAVLDDESLPTGELRPVAGTDFDFNSAADHVVEQAFQSDDQQARLVDGIDHPFVLNAPSVTKETVRLVSPASGISLTMRTDSDTVVVYTTNMGPQTWEMFGKTVSKHGGITLETQILPDAINHEGFGSIVLAPGETFKATTIYQIHP